MFAIILTDIGINMQYLVFNSQQTDIYTMKKNNNSLF